jgi:hypothetical protein
VVAQRVPAIENSSQQRIRTPKDLLYEGDERTAEQLHLSQLVEHQQMMRLPKPRLECPHTDVFERPEVDRILPHPRPRAADPGQRAAPSVQGNDVESTPAAGFGVSHLLGVETGGRLGQQGQGTQNHGRLATPG